MPRGQKSTHNLFEYGRNTVDSSPPITVLSKTAASAKRDKLPPLIVSIADFVPPTAILVRYRPKKVSLSSTMQDSAVTGL